MATSGHPYEIFLGTPLLPGAYHDTYCDTTLSLIKYSVTTDDLLDETFLVVIPMWGVLYISPKSRFNRWKIINDLHLNTKSLRLSTINHGKSGWSWCFNILSVCLMSYSCSPSACISVGSQKWTGGFRWRGVNLEKGSRRSSSWQKRFFIWCKG